VAEPRALAVHKMREGCPNPDSDIGPRQWRVHQNDHQGVHGLGMTCPARWWLFEPLQFESLPDGEADDLHDVGVGYDIDLPLACALRTDQAGQLELRQVMADRGDALTGFVGQAAHVTVPVGEQPQDMQADRRRKQGEHGGGVLQQPRRQWLG